MIDEKNFEMMFSPGSKKQREIGGIPLPEEFPEIEKSIEELPVYSHRGFSERNLLRYDNRKSGLEDVDNTLTGLEVAVGAGANILEVDLAQTKDAEYVLAHTPPGKKRLNKNLERYLKERPEALTLDELIDWLHHQDERLGLYLELKSDIELKRLLEAVDQSADRELLKRITLYSSDTKMMHNILRDKRQQGLTTEELKLFFMTNGLVNKKLIDQIDQLSQQDPESGVYGIEQGMAVVKRLSKNLRLLKGFDKTIDYAHSKGLKIITGTVNEPKLINQLINQGVDGIVPNNPVDFKMAGLRRPRSEGKIKLGTRSDDTTKKYLPESVRERLKPYDLERGEKVIEPLITAE